MISVLIRCYSSDSSSSNAGSHKYAEQSLLPPYWRGCAPLLAYYGGTEQLQGRCSYCGATGSVLVRVKECVSDGCSSVSVFQMSMSQIRRDDVVLLIQDQIEDSCTVESAVASPRETNYSLQPGSAVPVPIIKFDEVSQMQHKHLLSYSKLRNTQQFM